MNLGLVLVVWPLEPGKRQLGGRGLALAVLPLELVEVLLYRVGGGRTGLGRGRHLGLALDKLGFLAVSEMGIMKRVDS